MKVLVIGASLKPIRYSNKAIKMLKEYNHDIYATGLREGVVAGISIQIGFPKLTGIHTVTLYLNPQRQHEYYQYIIDLKPKRVIFNPGTENDEFYTLLKANHIKVEIACTLVLLRSDMF
jgi:predicted CoA-binding protein